MTDITRSIFPLAFSLGTLLAMGQTPGSVDLGFNPDDVGEWQGDGANYAEVVAIAVQPDGKLLVGGSFSTYDHRQGRTLVRLHPDGSVDEDFDDLFDPIPSGISERVNDVLVLPDGRVMVGGEFSTMFNRNLTVLLPNGMQDPGFSAMFMLAYPWDPDGSSASNVNDLLMQPDGKILVGGTFNTAGSAGMGALLFGLTRLLPNGQEDLSFQFQALMEPWMGEPSVRSLGLQQDGKVIVAGDLGSNTILRTTITGSIDATFQQPSHNGGVDAIVVQPDDKILIAGNFTMVGGVPRAGIARLLPNGQLDTGFNPGSAANARVHSIHLEPDGSIVLGGDFTTFNGQPAGRIARLSATGEMDGTFAAAGGFDEGVFRVVREPDGSLLVGGGFTAIQGLAHGRLTRLSAAGVADVTFAPASAAQGRVRCMLRSPDGSLMVGGYFKGYNGISRSGVARLLDDGALDPSFDPGSGLGPAHWHAVFAMALQPDGRVLLGGDISQYDGTPRNKLVRVLANGAIDNSFDVGSGFNGTVLAMRLATDGSIYVGGLFTEYNGVPCGRIARLNADGSLDATFNTGIGFNERVHALDLAPDGSIWVGGGFSAYNGTERPRLVQLSSSGALLPFDAGFTGNPGQIGISHVLLQPDGRVLVTANGFSPFLIGRLRRFMPDGSLDPSFQVTSGATGANDQVFALALDDAGRILVGGDFTSFSGVPRVRMARLLPNGSVDPAFDPGSGASHLVEMIVPLPDARLMTCGAFGSFDGTGRNRIARLFNGFTVDVEERIQAQHPWLYPNPTDGLLMVRVGEVDFTPDMLHVRSMDGRIVFEQRMTATHTTLDVQGIAAGTYTVELTDASGRRSVQRFVRQ